MTGPDSTTIFGHFIKGTVPMSQILGQHDEHTPGPMREIVDHFEDEEVKEIRLASISAMAKKLGDDARARKASIDDNLRRMPRFHKPKPRRAPRKMPSGWWVIPGLPLGLVIWWLIAEAVKAWLF